MAISSVLENNEVIIDLTGSGNFTSGMIKVVRVGNLVTISVVTTLTHVSLAAPSSALGAIPVWARPSSQKANLSTANGTVNRQVAIETTGAVGFNYRDWAGADSAQTSSGAQITISYVV